MTGIERDGGPAAMLDAVAALLLLRSDIRFRVAATEQEREAIYRLRADVVLSRRWAAPPDLPDGLERDAFDAFAVHLGGWKGGRLLAGARLVFPRTTTPLPTEEAFDLTVEPRGQVVDVSRMIVLRGAGTPDHRVFAALLSALWLEARARGRSITCGAFTPAMIRLFEAMGFRVRTLAPPRPYWGEVRFPVLVDPPRAAVEGSRRLARLLR